MKKKASSVLRSAALLLALLLTLSAIACAAPPPISSPDDPADSLADFITRKEGDRLTVLGVRDRTKKVYRIPQGVYAVDGAAFLGCNSIEEVSIPESVTSIGDGLLRHCATLQKITVANGNSVYRSVSNSLIHTASHRLIAGCATSTVPADGSVRTIGTYAFAGHTKLSSIKLPEGILYIEEGAFYGCTGLSSLSLPSSLTAIANRAFAGCERLLTLVLGSQVTTVEEKAFANCRSLYSVTLGKGLERIGEDAFAGCSKLIEVCNASSLALSLGGSGNGSVALYAKNVYTPTLGKSALWESDGFVFFDIPTEPLLIAYVGQKTALTLPSAAKEQPYAIYQYTFFASPVTSVTLPKTVTALGEGCFAGCRALEKVTLPSTLSHLPSNAFHGCTALSALSLPPSLTSVGENAFLGASSLTEYENGVLYVDTWAIGHRGSPSSISLRDGTRGIADAAFSSLKATLKYLTLPEGLKYIGSSAFEGCTDLTSTVFPETLLRIESNAFLGCRGMRELTLPASLQSIGAAAFSGCTGLSVLSVKGTSTVAGAGAFAGSKVTRAEIPAEMIEYLPTAALTEVTLTSGESIPSMAFYDSVSLRSLSLPKTVKKIGGSAFQRCSLLSTVTYAGTRADWETIQIGANNAYLTSAKLICK